MPELAIFACLGAQERRIAAHAIDHLLAPAMAGDGVTFACRADAGLAEVVSAPAGAIRMVSLLPLAEDEGRPWAETEALLHQTFASLADSGDPVFVMTVFRGLADRASESGQAMLLRVRRLNLLATELSRAYGAIVVDVDRVIADIGGRSLQTDHRLGGDLAAEVVGHELAMTLAANGLDACVSFEAQERARARLGAQKPAIRPAEALSPSDIIALGTGRSRQRVLMRSGAIQQEHASWLVRQILTGRIGPREALGRLVGALRRRGLKDSLALLLSALRQGAAQGRTA
ncbi:hypothetical protein H7F51_06485 [Novosphingobium flavum]|uniref:Uncharacterized protein n=1 Tax=Novosphingobium flavum TaxID=1778672 RepID=A0A7X1KL27_9SPHN|nr:hypothetical protein [Novosphingobium flavum]MBC2665159.1 hypothetical protein [Novosphingobium flavum]